MSDTLTTALEHPANDLRDLYGDHYPEAYINRGRTTAAWRDGDGDNVVISSRTMHDFVSGETYNAFTFLTQIAGYSKGEAATYLIGRAGLGDPAQERKAARREKRDKAIDVRAEAVKARRQTEALELQRTAPAEGVSAYLERKGVTELFVLHRVAPAYVDGQTVPGLVYSSDEHGPFVQLVMRNLEGTITGYQRLYDGERGKQFVYGTKPKGAFVLLEPLDKNPPKKIMFKKMAAKTFKSLPKSRGAVAGTLEAGYELAICEGVATGASIALARPHSFVFCALSAGNLAPVAEALRTAYGYTGKIKTDSGNKRKAVDLTICADFDEKQTGQRAAHRAALESGCYVRVPKFKHGYGDFNDLHKAKGLEAVKRTRRVTPDAALAFAKELGKQKLSTDKHLAPIALPSSGGALIVRAPQETGKTHRLAELLAGQGLRVLVVTHRESLAKNLAARLGFECYNDYPAYMLRDIPRLVICFDSLQKLSIGGALPNYDLLVLDESEQVLEHTTGRHIKHKAANFGAFEHYLKTAPRIIAADANAGRLTSDTLKRYNPERVITWQIHEHHIAAGRRVRFTHDRDDVLDALEAETRPAWYASDSLRHTRDVDAYLNDPATLTINSETATTDAAKAYLLDPTGQAPAHRRMIASPSVQTGLSDDSGHWQHVLGSFSGYSSTPQDAMQALMRARRVQQLTVYATRGRGEPVSVQEALERAAAADDFEAKGLKRDSYGDQNPNYERLRAEVASQRSRRQASYKSRLVLEAARLGYTVTYDVARDLKPAEVDARDERKEALKEAGLERYVRDRVAAERIDEARAKLLDEKYSRTQPEHFALEQYQLRHFYRLPDDITGDALADMLRVDGYKALREQVVRYENFVEPREVAEARAEGELEGGVLRGDAKAHLLRWEYHRELGKVVGMNAETEARAEGLQSETDRLEGELRTLRAEAEKAQTRRKAELDKQIRKLETDLAAYSLKSVGTSYSAKDDTVKAFVKWCCKNYRELKHAGLVTATLENLKAKPVETINDSLRRAGLEQVGDKKRVGKSYRLLLASVSAMGNYSRPRRENWESAQQKDIKIIDNSLLRKTAVFVSPTGLITAAQKPKNTPLPETASSPARPHRPAPQAERVSPWKTPGYEALRAFTRDQKGSETRTQLLEHFRYADSGDAAALGAITAYLQTPQVQTLLGMR